MLLIGAQARLLVFDNQYNIQGRATKDWDVAFDKLVKRFQALKYGLENSST
jgi:hypothetical protein